MSKFTVTITYDGAKFQVHGSSSPYRPPTLIEPPEGGIEDITAVYLLDKKGERVELPPFLQEEVDKRIIDDQSCDMEINDAVEECKESARIDDEERRFDERMGG